MYKHAGKAIMGMLEGDDGIDEVAEYLGALGELLKV